jgi:hypothetical protein
MLIELQGNTNRIWIITYIFNKPGDSSTSDLYMHVSAPNLADAIELVKKHFENETGFELTSAAAPTNKDVIPREVLIKG